MHLYPTTHGLVGTVHGGALGAPAKTKIWGRRMGPSCFLPDIWLAKQLWRVEAWENEALLLLHTWDPSFLTLFSKARSKSKSFYLRVFMFLCMCVYVVIYTCAHMFLQREESHLIPWSWGYRCLWDDRVGAGIWRQVLGISQQMLLTTKWCLHLI